MLMSVFGGAASVADLSSVVRYTNVCLLKLAAVSETFAGAQDGFRSKYCETCFQIYSKKAAFRKQALAKKPVNPSD
jgi:hypothetical protein